MNVELILLAAGFLLTLLFLVSILRFFRKKFRRIPHAVRIKRKIKQLASNSLEVTPKEFFKIRNATDGKGSKKYISSQYDFSGVYILYNHSKKMYYVGQAVKTFQRVNNHFTGHGNGDVYADYKYGDRFTIKMIALKNSRFKTLNELERHTISQYDAYAKGYNRTRGNRG